MAWPIGRGSRERYVTIPLEVQLAGMQNATSVRTSSLFGLSDVKVQFDYNDTYNEAKQDVMNRLSQLSPLPGNIQPSISPTSPTGEIYRYRIVGPPGFSLTDLKTLQDWVLDRRFRAVPGVIDVTGWGGLTKTYDVSIDLAKLQNYGLTLTQVLTALNNSNINVGGDLLSIGPQSAVVRGLGLIHSMDDIRNTVLIQNQNNPVLVSDVATVSVGHKPRQGIAGMDKDDDIVQGIVLLRRGTPTLPTLKLVEAEVEKMNTSGVLPPGVRIVPYYDRTDLINVTTHTVLHNIVTGIVLIFLVQWIFLGNLRSAIVVATTIPFALSTALIIMTLRGESANLLSVGAIDFGLIVDCSVLMVENIFRHLVESRHPRPGTSGQSSMLHQLGDYGLSGRLAIIHAAASEVGISIFFSAAIIIAAFVPLFGLGGIAGHIFSPMAKTYAYALLGAMIATSHRLACPFSPASAARSGRQGDFADPPTASRLPASPAFRRRHRVLTLGVGVLLVVTSILADVRCSSNSCRNSRKAICGSGPPCRHRSRSPRVTAMSTGCARSCSRLPKSLPSSRSTAAPTTEPTRRASTMPNSSCR